MKLRRKLGASSHQAVKATLERAEDKITALPPLTVTATVHETLYFRPNGINELITKAIFCQRPGYALGKATAERMARKSLQTPTSETFDRQSPQDYTSSMGENEEFGGLLDSSEVFASAFRDSPVAMTLVDADTHVRFAANQAFEETFGKDRRHLKGKSANENDAWVDTAQRDSLLKSLAEAGEFHSQPVSIFREEGELRHGLASGKLIKIGNRRCFLFQILDITEREFAAKALLASKNRFEFLFAKSPTAMVLARADDGTFIDGNPAFEKLLGYSRDEFIGRSSPELGHWADDESRKEVLRRLSVEHEIRGKELKFLTKSGPPLTVRCSFVLTDWNGENVVLTTIEDITEKALADEALREGRRKFDIIFNQSPICMTLSNVEDGVFLDANPAVERVLGYSRGDIIGVASNEVGHWVNLEQRDEIRKRVVSEGQIRGIAVKFYSKDRRILTTWCSFTMTDWDGKQVVLTEAEDITEKILAEKAVLENRKRFEFLFNQSPIAMTLTTAEDGILVDGNAALEKMLGYSKDEYVGTSSLNLKIWVSKKERNGVVNRLWTERQIIGREIQFYTKSRSILTMRCSFVLTEWEDRQVILTTLEDVTEKSLAAETILKGKKRFELLFTQSSLPISLTTAEEAIFIDANPAFEKMLGFPKNEFIGKRSGEFLKAVDVEKRDESLERLRLNGRFLGSELPFRTRKGKLLTLLCSSSIIEWDSGPVWMTSFEDVTEMRMTEERNKVVEKELAETKRLDALGRLAGGIAHDFNNLVAAILGQVELMRLLDNLGETPLRRLEKISNASNRARDLVRKILHFSRQQVQPRKIVPLDMVIGEALNLLESRFPKNIRVEFTRPKGECTVLGDASQLHEVFMNLGINSMHAIGDASGHIKVDVATTVRDDGSKTVEVVFQDNGSGIDPTNLPNIFDPFFTTKRAGSGTGLGLSVVHGIVEEFNGRIAVESRLGQGATFRISFPFVEAELDIGDNTTEQVRFGSGESILLVDDEADLLDSTGGLLEFLGYTVVRSSSAIEAVKAFDQGGRSFDVVISDLSMPGMTGIDLARRLSELGSKVPVILCSGYMNALSAELLEHVEVSGFLNKPVETVDLSREVHRVLSLSRERPAE